MASPYLPPVDQPQVIEPHQDPYGNLDQPNRGHRQVSTDYGVQDRETRVFRGSKIHIMLQNDLVIIKDPRNGNKAPFEMNLAELQAFCSMLPDLWKFLKTHNGKDYSYDVDVWSCYLWNCYKDQNLPKERGSGKLYIRTYKGHFCPFLSRSVTQGPQVSAYLPMQELKAVTDFVYLCEEVLRYKTMAAPMASNRPPSPHIPFPTNGVGEVEVTRAAPPQTYHQAPPTTPTHQV